MTDLSNHALAVAFTAHWGQVDKLGVPYIEHPMAVAGICADLGHGDEKTFAVAYLHDVIEDTFWCTTLVLKEMGFPADVIEAVDLLTRKKGVPDEEYYFRIRQNELAKRVKYADIRHNTLPERLEQLPPEVSKRLIRRYTKALEALGS